jgi:hypothetical protein
MRHETERRKEAMFEKAQQAIDEKIDENPVVAEPVNKPAEVVPAAATFYGLFNAAEVSIEGDTVVITVPLRKGVTTVRAHKAVVAAWATDNVAGQLLDEAKNLRS